MASPPPQPVPFQSMESSGSQPSIVTNIFKKVENVFVSNSSADTNHESHKRKCLVHDERSVEFLCVPCDEDICQLCKMSEHEGHETKSISLAAEDAKKIWMSVSSSRIKQYEQTVRNTLDETKRQMQDLTQAENAIVKQINDRCSHLQCLIGGKGSESSTVLAKIFEERLRSAQMKMQRPKQKCISFSELNVEESMQAIGLRQEKFMDMINEQKEQQVVHLKAMKREACDELATCAKNMEEELEAIAHLRERMDMAIKEKDHVDILNLHRQLAVEFSAEQLRNRLCKLSHSYHCTLYHEADESIDENEIISDIFWRDQKEIVERYIQKFLGQAVKNLAPAREGVEGIAVQLKPAFHCNEQRNAHVKSICPHGDQQVMVSFCTQPYFCTPEGEGQTKKFDLTGRELELTPFGVGTLTRISNAENKVSLRFLSYIPAYVPALDLIYKSVNVSLFAKHEKHYILQSSHKDGKYCFNFYLFFLDKDYFRELPVGKYSSNMDIINTTAFDASTSGDSFAVVIVTFRNTSNVHGFQDGIQFDRELLILDRTSKSFQSHKYKPPTSRFYPTDVCFLQVNGEEVLAVTDMGNDAIHLCCRSSDGGEFVFRRFLVEGHQLLKGPTALNTDSRGSLWVACKGGHLVVAEMLFSDSEG
ncbi:hypothetical protein ACOMHN_004482 [Nucella lapillus]